MLCMLILMMFVVILRLLSVKVKFRDMVCKTIHHENVEINDPGIVALVDELGLVPGRRPPLFCELYKRMVAMRERRKREEDFELMRLYHNHYKRGRRPVYGVLEKQLTLF